MATTVAEKAADRKTNSGRRGRTYQEDYTDPRVLGVELSMELTARDLSEIDTNNLIIRLLAERNKKLMRRVDANREKTRALEQGPCAA